VTGPRRWCTIQAARTDPLSVRQTATTKGRQQDSTLILSLSCPKDGVHLTQWLDDQNPSHTFTSDGHVLLFDVGSVTVASGSYMFLTEFGVPKQIGYNAPRLADSMPPGDITQDAE
jgi:hypothetical protein